MSSVTIDRFELVFLNPEENRWQLFQEIGDYSEGETRVDGANYRGQAQRLLQSVRITFEEHCKEFDKFSKSRAMVILNEKLRSKGLSEITAIEVSSLRKEKTVIIDVIGLRETLTRALPLGDSNSYHSYLGRVEKRFISSVEIQGVKDCRHGEIFKALALSLQGEPIEQIELTRSDALTLLSTLFIARHWDLFGRVSFPAEAKSSGGAGPSGALDPYFACAIEYTRRTPTRGKTEAALGYRVDMQVAGKQGFFDQAREFFEACHDPQTDEERFWYCFYGALIDSINLGLAKSPENRSSKVEDVDKKTVHIVSIPLRICGYDHFLQLHLLPFGGDGPGDASIWTADYSRLFIEALLEAHCGKEAPVGFRFVLKESLRELLVQMHIAAFQHHIFTDLGSYRKKSEPIDDIAVDQSFSRHAPNLVRLDGIFLNGVTYKYVADDAGPATKWAKVSSPGSERKRPREGHGVVIKKGLIEADIEADIDWENRFDGPMNELFRETGYQRLFEQYQWFKKQADLHNSILRAAGSIMKHVG